MTKLPSDSFLPSGAMEAELQLSLAGLANLTGSYTSSSVISPLSLPGGVQYFEPRTRPSVTSHPNAVTARTWSPIDGIASADPPQAQPASFLSPHLTPIPSHAQYQLQSQRHPQQRASSLSPTRGPSRRRRHDAYDRRAGAMESDLARQAPSSGVSVPVDTISGTGSGLITVRKPAVRINSVHDSMATEYRSSALDQDYRRLERMRQAFDDERRHLQASRDRAEEVYKEIINEVEDDHARQRSQWETEKFELQSQVMQLQNRLKEFEARLKTSPDIISPSLQPRSSSQISPAGQPGAFPPTVCRRTSTDSPLTAMDCGPSKVIDVQEYHKDLEGIHLRENFVKMETFTDTPPSSESKPASRSSSPPQHPDGSRALARARSIRALRADAHSRLTINAGHTPTVSLSVAHTGTSNTVVSSGSNTPTLMSGDGAMSSDGNEFKHESSEPAEPAPTHADNEHAPAIMDPSDDDVELKGPLMLRNMPAKDEFFLKKLSDKLEKAASGEDDATPTVLRHSDDEDENETSKPKDVEDIPLKLRSTCSNFGKPFGVA
ncbi:hypothetical protein BD289DRAFT_449666 [Coniella lustricola]|uniref:Uncharacterized protein n=1 Tax=Coniella lustricola TaxID=2025994 RepID=A0A2T3ALP0_9PEZI|nr:hypothetical protein BD289DRAFT_449666 [Coniella lustricola]